MTRTADHNHWSHVSSEWIAWARAPNHDAFWAYRASLIAFIGRGEGKALDVGGGEGRVSRELKACGYRVTSSDPVWELVNAAREARSADDYAIASGTDLPFEDAHFDLVMAYNVLMDVEDVPATLKEIRRVLRPAGTLVISIVHPFADRGRFAGPDANAPFVLQKSYFGRERFKDTEVRNGTLLHGSVVRRRGVDGIAGPRFSPWAAPVPFKANQDRRHHIPKQRHRVTNSSPAR